MNGIKSLQFEGIEDGRKLQKMTPAILSATSKDGRTRAIIVIFIKFNSFGIEQNQSIDCLYIFLLKTLVFFQTFCDQVE